MNKAPLGGEKQTQLYRSQKNGVKLSILTESRGISLSVVIDGSNRCDI